MARLPEWWEMIKIPWNEKCGETGFCPGFADYAFNKFAFDSMEKAAKEVEMEILYGGTNEQSRIS